MSDDLSKRVRKEKLFSIIQQASDEGVGFNRNTDLRDHGLDGYHVGAIIRRAKENEEMYEDGSGLVWITGFGPGVAKVKEEQVIPISPDVSSNIADLSLPGLYVCSNKTGAIAPVFQKLPKVNVTITLEPLSVLGQVWYSRQPEGENWQYIREESFLLVRSDGGRPDKAYPLSGAVRLKFAQQMSGGQYQITEARVMEGYEVWVKTS